MLHGVISFHELAMPICGFAQSSSVSPMARSIARAGAFCMPSVTSRERGLMSLMVPEGTPGDDRAAADGQKPMLSSMNSLVTMSSAVRSSGGAWPSAA